MAAWSPSPFVLYGGCFCSAIRYTISVPTLVSRPLIPDPPKKTLGPQSDVMKRLPMISIDHCNSCRRVSGSVLQCWFIFPVPWMSFSLLLRSENSKDSAHDRIAPESTLEVLQPGARILETTYLSYFSSSKDVNRTFCGNCGTNLTFYYSGDDDEMASKDHWGPHFDVALGTLDKESVEMQGIRPTRQGSCEDGIGWVTQMVGNGEWMRSSDA